MKREDLERIAYHEAGHAVLSHFLGIGLEKVTIIPDGESAGHSMEADEWSTDVEDLRIVAEEAFWQRHAIVRYAGAEAVRHHAPRSRWKSGADNDYRWASIALEKITGGRQSILALRTYAERRARVLVAHYWPEIRHLASALVIHKVLDRRKATKEILASFNRRRAMLMEY